jgi:photosystem II stability/assembly factor-like uncharacterized protein
LKSKTLLNWPRLIPRLLRAGGASTIVSLCHFANLPHGDSAVNLKGAFYCLVLSFAVVAAAAAEDPWTDVGSKQIGTLDKQPWPGGCAGVAVDRLTGDVVVNFVGNGVWRSKDRGSTWVRIDQETVSGRGETGWSVQVDQNDPKRMAVFSLDGDAGYTVDGVKWKKFKSLGRNWDFGSIDWASPDAQVILAGKHESEGEVYLSTDGGSDWHKLSIVMDPVKNKDECMIGVLDSKTLIYSYANGIQRSTDQGRTWNEVSKLQPRSKIPILFNKAHYLCTSEGLAVSSDLGATWKVQGSKVDIWQGPWFGADENSIVAIGPEGIFKTTTGGKEWTKVSALRPSAANLFSFSPKWYGGYAWDPKNDIVYTTCMAYPVFKNLLKQPGQKENEKTEPRK